jgi:excisionase family DNA binding protein
MAAVATTTTRHLVSLTDAAKLLGVHTRTLRRYIAEGRIQGYRIGPRLVKVDTRDLDSLMRPIPTAGQSA